MDPLFWSLGGAIISYLVLIIALVVIGSGLEGPLPDPWRRLAALFVLPFLVMAESFEPVTNHNHRSYTPYAATRDCFRVVVYGKI